jgi:hypothetical protein
MEYRLANLSPSKDIMDEVELFFESFMLKLASSDDDIGPPFYLCSDYLIGNTDQIFRVSATVKLGGCYNRRHFLPTSPIQSQAHDTKEKEQQVEESAFALIDRPTFRLPYGLLAGTEGGASI